MFGLIGRHRPPQSLSAVPCALHVRHAVLWACLLLVTTPHFRAQPPAHINPIPGRA